MNSKYYISEKPFFNGLNLDKVWGIFVPYLEHIADEIVIVHQQFAREFELSKSLFELSDFKGEKPFKTTISQKPYLEITNRIYICKHYKPNKDIYKIISTEWLKELKNEYICPQFVIKYKDKHEFMVDNEKIIALLDSKSLNLFNTLGFEFKEWNVKLNNTL